MDEQISVFGPDVIGLQEVCLSQRDFFRAEHPTWTAVFTNMRAEHPDCGGDPQGQLLASPHPIENVEVKWLPGDTDMRRYRLLCATVLKPEASFRACTTHLRVNDPDAAEVRKLQAGKIVEHAQEWTGQMPFLLTGDLNSVPYSPPMDRLYAIDGGYGPFYEADQTDGGVWPPKRVGDLTFPKTGKKYDYAMMDTGHVVGPGTLSGGVIAVDPSHSDHYLLRAWFRVA